MTESCAVFKCGRLVDGRGGEPIERAVLVIRNEKIETVCRESEIVLSPERPVVDISRMTVMPGMIDAHIHPMGIKNLNPLSWMIDPPELRAVRAAIDAWRIIDSGFTTIRDCCNPLSLHLKKAAEEGSIIGPRVFSCGRIITQTAGHGDTAHFLPQAWSIERGTARIADGVAECRKAAREQLREGADFIKICTTGGIISEKDKPTSTQFSIEEIRAIAEEAHAYGVKLASHAIGTAGIKNALIGGVDTIEHGVCLDDETIEMMIRQKTFLIPTLAIMKALIEEGEKAGLPTRSLDKAKQVYERHQISFQMACDAGIKIGLGTDYLSDPTSPMGKSAVELALYVKAGRSPMEAIVSATKINAEALGAENEIGTLEPGKVADFIVVDGDPLKDINILQDRTRIIAVFKNGKKIPRLNIG